MTPEERHEVISLREHLEQRFDTLGEDLDRLEGKQDALAEKVNGLVSWRALAAILTVIAALATFVFSVADHV